MRSGVYTHEEWCVYTSEHGVYTHQSGVYTHEEWCVYTSERWVYT